MTKPLVRIVDDDAALADSFELLLTTMGWDVRYYPDGRTFLDTDSLSGPGCVVLDMRMPGMTGNDGEALRIAVRDVGVPLSHMQYIASYPCGIVVNGRNGPYCRWWFITGQGGILVNKKGERFVTELEGICHVTPKLAANPDGCHYVLADKATWDRTHQKIKLGALVGLPSWTAERVEAEFAKGENLWKADTLEELCEKSGVDPNGLKKQIAVWNEAVETKNDLQFGRKDQQWKLTEGPWYMIRMFPWNNLSCGGNACGFAHTSGFMAGKYATGYKEA